MDAASSLLTFSRDLYTLFSDSCIERLTGRPSFTLPPSITRDLLVRNVEKEVAKDRLVIELAVFAFRSGAQPSDNEIGRLIERAREIDRDFLQGMSIPSMSIQVHHDAVHEVRAKRFRYLADVVLDLLPLLDGTRPLGEAVPILYTADQFRGFVGELLFLFCVEVKMLAGSVRFLSPFNRAMDTIIDEAVEAMESVRPDVAAAVTNRFFAVPNSVQRGPFASFFQSLLPIR